MKLLVIFLFFIEISFSLFAQSKPSYGEVNIASPTAAALGKYGDIPINYHTGIPQIDLPIYTIKEGPLTLPVSLSYHASGIKLMETASWVGLGWSLNAGGVITRSVQGAPDEKGTSNTSSSTYGEFSDYGYCNYLYQSGIQDWANFANGNKDGQADLFFFNFGGYSGKFYFADDRTPVIVPQQDFKIAYTYAAGSSIQNFTITTPDGVKYSFGNSAGITGSVPVESTNPWNLQSGASSGTVISSWFLNKIQTADGLFSINLQYAAENYGYFTIGSHPVDPVHIYNGDKGYYLTKNIVSGVRLSKIVFSNGEVDFIANTSARSDLSDIALSSSEGNNVNAKALNQIQIKDNLGFCKSYNFSYSYFSDANNTTLPTEFTNLYSNIHTDLKRLKLDSIQEISCDAGISVPPYNFTYSTQNLPRRLCFAQDYWGFNNGKTYNNTLIPTYSTIYSGTPTVYNGADRNTSWPDMEAGTLKKISYPTGGSTSFDFNPNDVYEDLSYQGYKSGTSLYVHLPGAESITSQTLSITITDANYPLKINVTNTAGSGWNATLTIKDHSSGAIAATYNIPDGTNGDITPPLTLSLGTYDCTLSVPTGATGGCKATISYNWGITSKFQNAYIGGLRIRTITQSSGIGNDIVTNYSYYDNSSHSTGVIYDIPTYIQPIRNDLIATVGYWSTSGFQPNNISPNGCATAPSPEYYVSAGTLRPMSSVQGSHIGYKQVIVSQTNNGYSVFHYYTSNYNQYNQQTSPPAAITTADISTCYSSTPNFPAAPLPLDFKRGELYYEEHFDNGGSKLKDVFYYPYFDTTAIPATPVFVATSVFNGFNTQYFGTFDSIRSVRKDSVKIIQTDYSADGSSTVTQKAKYYGSKYHNELSRETGTDSKGNNVESIYKYAFDFRITSCDNSNCLTSYTSTCASCQTSYTNTRQSCNGDTCLTNAYTAFLQCKNTARINYVTCRRNSFTNPDNTYQVCHNTAKNSANTDLKPILEMQDKYINAPVETTGWRNSQLVSGSFNKFLRTTDSNIYISKLQKINLASPSSSFTNAVVNGSGLTKDNRYADETIINYNLGNVHDATPKAGVTLTYIWDYKSNLPIAKISNASPADSAAYTSFEADGKGNWDSYTGTITTVATAPFPPTGTKYYNLTTTKTLSKTVINANKYIVSYWSKNGSYSITGASGSVVSGMNVNGWTYYQHNLQATSTSIKISGTGSIDEVRLYPANAQMITYTYRPLVGITSQCDANNKINYYAYDALGRLSVIKDQENSILKEYCYNYAGQVSNCQVSVQSMLQSKDLGTSESVSLNIDDNKANDSSAIQPDTAVNLQTKREFLTITYIDEEDTLTSQNNDSSALLLKLENYKPITGDTINFTSTLDTNEIYSFIIPSLKDSSAPAQQIPVGIYNISISKASDNKNLEYAISGPAGKITAGEEPKWINVPLNARQFNKISVKSF